MARQRDYKAEYRRRVERERARAAAEGREFNLSKARGHVSRAHEQAQRQRYKERRFLATLLTPDLIERSREPRFSKAAWQSFIDDALEVAGPARTAEILLANIEGKEGFRAGQDKGENPAGARVWGMHNDTYRLGKWDHFLPIYIFMYRNEP